MLTKALTSVELQNFKIKVNFVLYLKNGTTQKTSNVQDFRIINLVAKIIK